MRDSSLILGDPRALLEGGRSPAKPEDPRSVQAAFPEDPGLRLELRAEKHIGAYSAWLWEGNDGQAYYSKLMRNGKTLAWKPGATIKRVLWANPSLRDKGPAALNNGEKE